MIGRLLPGSAKKAELARSFFVCVLIGMAAQLSVAAQPATLAPTAPTAPLALKAPFAPMVISPLLRAELTPAEQQLVAKLKQGGYAILLRHAETEPGVGDPPGYQLEQCASQRNLSAAGRAWSQALGGWFKVQNIQVSKVYASPWCRTLDTASLAFAERLPKGREVQVEPFLGSTFDAPAKAEERRASLERRIANMVNSPKLAGDLPAGNAVFVTHQVNITALTQLNPEMGEMVIVRPDGCCKHKVVGRLKL